MMKSYINKNKIFLLFFVILAISVFFLKKNIIFSVVNNYIKIINPFNHSYNEVLVTQNKIVRSKEIEKIIYNKPKFDLLYIKNQILKLPWIEEVKITRNINDKLVVQIKEYQPFAILHFNNKKFLVTRKGKIIKEYNSNKYYYLPNVTGDGVLSQINSLFNILAFDSQISKDVKLAQWIGKRRWNIVMDNGLTIKLPSEKTIEAWNKLVELYNIPGFTLNLLLVDMRNLDSIYLKYSE